MIRNWRQTAPGELAMQSVEYKRLYQAEGRLWWFRAMHLFLLKLLPKEHHQKPNLFALDIGCGTGALLGQLLAAGFETLGLDYSPIALEYAGRRPNHGLLRASANDLPFDSTFDLVVSVDLLEVESVDPERLVANALRCLKPGGYGLFVMAAHQWLLSEHDQAVNSVRRYSLSQMKALFDKPDVKVLRATYLFFFLFPLIALRKLLNPARNGKKDRQASSDVSVPPAWINTLLYIFCWMEAQLISILNMPIGSSALVLVRKSG